MYREGEISHLPTDRRKPPLLPSHHCGPVDAAGDGIGVQQVRPQRLKVGIEARDDGVAINWLATAYKDLVLVRDDGACIDRHVGEAQDFDGLGQARRDGEGPDGGDSRTGPGQAAPHDDGKEMLWMGDG